MNVHTSRISKIEADELSGSLTLEFNRLNHTMGLEAQDLSSPKEMIDYLDGATPLGPDEIKGLKLTHISTRQELDRWEAENIQEAMAWGQKLKKKSIASVWQSLILVRWNPLFADLSVESLIFERQAEYYQALQESTPPPDRQWPPVAGAQWRRIRPCC